MDVNPTIEEAPRINRDFDKLKFDPFLSEKVPKILLGGCKRISLFLLRQVLLKIDFYFLFF